MPLANQRDKLTQIRWGIRDFEHRFGRRPEGMWLAETAVDRNTLSLLAGEGIKFTILSPYQAVRWRFLEGDSQWARLPLFLWRREIYPYFFLRSRAGARSGLRPGAGAQQQAPCPDRQVLGAARSIQR
jgi:hypothetical protein